MIDYWGRRCLLYLLIAVEAVGILWRGALLELLKEAGGVLEHTILLELMMI